MSAPVSSRGDSYRCDACRRKKNRCASCREARAAYRRELRRSKIAAGICSECTEPATSGTLCDLHQRRNREASKRSHAAARAEGRE